MSVWSWFGRKKKAAAGTGEPAAAEPETGTEAAASGDTPGGEAIPADTVGGEKGEETAGCPAAAAESAVGAGVGIPRQQSAGDVEGSEAGESARQ
ncbi:hypothetical protein ABZ714_14430 [Streptomyces sp. NPDC006798]|uniref:hypothetical protein n=1 Tax=Streptomyces sp. NPDC006798 TaxID=3155462 RepID=UPI0033F1E5F2